MTTLELKCPLDGASLVFAQHADTRLTCDECGTTWRVIVTDGHVEMMRPVEDGETQSVVSEEPAAEPAPDVLTCPTCGGEVTDRRNAHGMRWCLNCQTWKWPREAPEMQAQPHAAQPVDPLQRYGPLVSTTKELPKDEPYFLLRGQDALAPSAIMNYGTLLGAAGQHDLAEKAHEAAYEVRRWQERNPGRVKFPD